eukprot:TRINITY_DN9491_c0_g1_i1.p1 TRINITY_DN9491_c0_g1~~TRINITY_DN9491_c0_g1_i1.p1  ORF type:complete len:463 (+),score=50.57 TRINITY_DN9491_c0_g1_i1:25-1389(+)
MGLPKCVSALVALLAIVPLLVAADGIYAAFFPSDVPLRLLSEAAFQFPGYALPTDSGYLPVDDASPARMFYAYYEALRPLTPPADTPIILWLQGGPGCSSMTGNFYEFGPWRTAPDMQLHRNNATWNARFGLLFLDNPVGSGYSIADDDQQIPTDQQQVAEHLWAALNHFFHHHPAFHLRPFFLAGESYAGKYVPALGYYIMRQHDLHSHRNFRLDGLLIGNGLTHPVVQVQTHAQTAYAFALIDHQQRAHVEELAGEVVRLVEEEEWLLAAVARTALVDYIQNESGLATLLDVRRSVPYHCAPDATDFLAPFLNQPAVKAALKAHPSAVWVSCNPRVRRVLLPDVMKSVKWQVEQLLQRYPILLYQGQYDAKDGVACSEEWMTTLTWNHLLHFFAADRKIWKVEGDLAGYWRTFDTLTHVVVAGAGHQVPADQGLFAQRMVETWLGHVLSTAV